MADMDAPRLMVTEPEFAENIALGEANGYLRPADERDIHLVSAWLREQEAGSYDEIRLRVRSVLMEYFPEDDLEVIDDATEALIVDAALSPTGQEGE